MHRDIEHLRMLSIFHYVVSGLMVMCGFFPFIHLGLGIAMVSGAFGQGPNPPPPEMGWFFIAGATAVILAVWAMAVCVALTGWKLSKRTNYWFCFVVAIVECLFQPFGIVLGIFTIIVLQRPSVKELFLGPNGEQMDDWDQD